jgi:hypothetical protein
MNRIPYLLHGFALEDFRHLELERLVLETYETVMRRYLQDRPSVPDEDLVEIRFEDLERDPLGTVARVYDQLGLAGREEALRVMGNSLRAEVPYHRQPRPIPPATAELVAHRWGFSFDAWRYPTPDRSGGEK